MRISYSGLDSYRTCPLKYKFQNVDRIKEPKSKEQVFGTLIHSTMRFIHSPSIVSATLEEAVNHFAQNWNGSLYAEELEERSAFSTGVRIIERYYRQNDPADFTVVDLESRFEVGIGDEVSGRHVIAGIIDRIDRTETGYEIIDYKTGNKMPSQEKVDNDLQLSIYLSAFLKRYPKERANMGNIVVSLYFLKHGVKLSSTRSEADLEALERGVLELVSHIEAGEFEPRLNPLCDWCGYQKICPLWKHRFASERRVETEEARQAIGEYLVLKDELSEKKSRLAELQETILRYMEAEGVTRVFGGAGVIGKSVRATYRYDEDAVRTALGPIGRLEEVLAVDSAALRKVLPTLPAETRKALDAAKSIKSQSISLTVKKGVALEDEEAAAESA